MTEVYIQGIGKCKKKIRKALAKSHLMEGDHFIEGVNSLHEHNHTLLYWKTGRITLREFKEAIGAKIIWEHRLRFYESVNDLPKEQTSPPDKLTDYEVELMAEYRR